MWSLLWVACGLSDLGTPAIGEAERRCYAYNDAHACFDAARERYERREIEASALYERACLLGNGMGCRNRGLFAKDRLLGMPRNLAVAAEFFEKGCEAGEAGSCNQRGYLLIVGDDGDLCQNPGVGWYRRAAAMDDDEGLSRIAIWEADCPGGDPVEARVLDERACARGLGVACRHLAVLWKGGVGGPASDEAWLRSLERSCAASRSDPEGCYQLGAALYVRAEPDAGPAALAALEKGCARGHAVACRNVGVLIEEAWHGVKFDRAAMLAAYAKGCAAGDEQSCEAKRE
jgi:TPR repeat protein